MTDEPSLPDLPETLGPDELWSIYEEADPSRAAALGFPESSPEAWERIRKYAYARYWAGRLAARAPIEGIDIETWRRAIGLGFLRNVALGVIGDAARANLLTSAQIEDLLAGELNPYASRSLRARRLVMDRQGVDATLIDALLNERGAWALLELVEAGPDAGARAALTAAAADPRMSRAERHALREALRRIKAPP